MITIILFAVIIYLIIAGYTKIFPFNTMTTSPASPPSPTSQSLSPYDRQGTVVVPFYPNYYRPPWWWNNRRHNRHRRPIPRPPLPPLAPIIPSSSPP